MYKTLPFPTCTQHLLWRIISEHLHHHQQSKYSDEKLKIKSQRLLNVPTSHNVPSYDIIDPEMGAPIFRGETEFYILYHVQPSGGSRISPRRGRQLSEGGGEAPKYDFDKFSQKLHEIERIWTPVSGEARDANAAE